MYSIKTRTLKAVFAGAAVALVLPLSAFAGHDNLLRELARTDGDASGAASHIEATTMANTSARTGEFITQQLAVTEGYSVPLAAAKNAQMVSAGSHDAMPNAASSGFRGGFADGYGGA
jgi:hypothetical protein